MIFRMKIFRFPIVLIVIATVGISSCASKPAARPETPIPAIPAAPPEKPVPKTPENIMGQGIVPQDKLADFLLMANPDAALARRLAGFYVEEAGIEGVNHDVAFAQMCLETGFLRFGNLVTPDMNNFCGLGAMDAAHPGERFPNPRTGVRAHIQHLKGYATDAPLKQELVDPRYKWILPKGKSPTIAGLAGTWATDPDYAAKISGILTRLFDSIENK
jgi:hypothetical protein